MKPNNNNKWVTLTTKLAANMASGSSVLKQKYVLVVELFMCNH